MPLQNDRRPRDHRPGTSQIAQLGGFEHSEVNVSTAASQDEARRCGDIARHHALAALCLGGALAFQQAALGSHYARRAVSLMVGRRA